MRYASLLLILTLCGGVQAQDTDRLLQALATLESPNAPALVADLQSRAAGGDPTAQYWYGRYLHDLAPIEARNFVEARSWLERASTGGHAGAAGMLARIHEIGFIVPSDRDLAARYFQRMLELGVTSAGHDLARIEFNREPRDGARVIDFLEQSARGGHPPSIIDLAYLHASGTVSEVNGTEAHRWAMRGAELDQARCMSLLAKLYANGLGVEPDVAEALKWAILARDAGDTESEALVQEIANSVPEYVHREARARALAWREARGG